MAAMREALSVMCYAATDVFRYFRGTPFAVLEELWKAFDNGKAALAAPPRTCDKFGGETEAMIAFLNEVWLISVKSLKDDPFDGWAPEMKARYAKWLMEKEGGVK